MIDKMRLERYIELKDRLKKLKMRYRLLKSRSEGGGIDYVSVSSSGGVSDRVGRLAVKLVEAERQIHILQREIGDVQREVSKVNDGNVRKIIKLRYYKDLTWSEISRIMGVPRQTLQSRVAKYVK